MKSAVFLVNGKIMEDLQDDGKLHVEMLKLTICSIISTTAGMWFIKSLVDNGSEVHVVLFITDVVLISSSFETKAKLSKTVVIFRSQR